MCAYKLLLLRCGVRPAGTSEVPAISPNGVTHSSSWSLIGSSPASGDPPWQSSSSMSVWPSHQRWRALGAATAQRERAGGGGAAAHRCFPRASQPSQGQPGLVFEDSWGKRRRHGASRTRCEWARAPARLGIDGTWTAMAGPSDHRSKRDVCPLLDHLSMIFVCVVIWSV